MAWAIKILVLLLLFTCLLFTCLPSSADAQLGNLEPLQGRTASSVPRTPTAWGFEVGLAGGIASFTTNGGWGDHKNSDFCAAGSVGVLYRALEREIMAGWQFDLMLHGCFGPSLTDFEDLRFLLSAPAEAGVSRAGGATHALRPFIFLGPGYSFGSLSNGVEGTDVGDAGLVVVYGFGAEYRRAQEPLSFVLGLRTIARASSKGRIYPWEGEPRRIRADESDLLGFIEVRYRIYQ